MASATMDVACECLACTTWKHHQIPCVGMKRVDKHMEEVTVLLARSPEIITLLVGPDGVTMECHKLLLSYYSSYFDRLLYGSRPNPNNANHAPPQTLTLSELNTHEMEKFLQWIYTGDLPWTRLFGDPELENLWVLGSWIGAPAFCNTAMYLIFKDYDSWSVNAQITSYSFENTGPQDGLWKFMVDLIKCNGPFSEKSNLTRKEKDEWVRVLAKGGEIIEALVEYGFDKEGDTEPMMAGEWGKYLVDEEEGKKGGPGEWRVEKEAEKEEEGEGEKEKEDEDEVMMDLPIRDLTLSSQP